MRPEQPAVGRVEHIEPDLSPLLDEHKQLIADGQRRSHVPRIGNRSRFVARPVGERQPPPQRSLGGRIVSRQDVALPPARRGDDAPQAVGHGEPPRFQWIALDGKHELAVARDRAARGVGKRALHRAGLIPLGILDAFHAAFGHDLAIGPERGSAAGLQPDAFSRLEVNCEQPHRRVQNDQAIDRQRVARRQEGRVMIGEELPPLFQKPRFLGVSRERHPVAGHQQRPGCHRDRVAGRIAAVQPPFGVLAIAGPGGLSGDRLEERGCRIGRKRQRHVPTADPGGGGAATADLLEDFDRSLSITRQPPSLGPHHGERRLESRSPARLQAIEPGGCRQRLVRLERLERRQHGGLLAGGRMKPAAGDGNHAV